MLFILFFLSKLQLHRTRNSHLLKKKSGHRTHTRFVIFFSSVAVFEYRLALFWNVKKQQQPHKFTTESSRFELKSIGNGRQKPRIFALILNRLWTQSISGRPNQIVLIEKRHFSIETPIPNLPCSMFCRSVINVLDCGCTLSINSISYTFMRLTYVRNISAKLRINACLMARDR